MTPEDEPELPRTEREGHAERLGFALRGLAAELVEERQKAAELRREVTELRAQLESRHQAIPEHLRHSRSASSHRDDV